MTSPLSAKIQAIVDTYLADGRAETAIEINSGQCQDISADIIRMLDREMPTARAAEVFVDDYLEGDFMDDDRAAFDRARLASNWPEVQPPEDLSWDDMDEISGHYGFAGSSHVWVVIDGRHYDAEAPDGVDNPFELPYFTRVFDHYRSHRKDPSPTSSPSR